MKYKFISAIFMMAITGHLSLSAQKLVDKNATKETQMLYKNLQVIQGKSIMIGHQDDTAYGIAWKYEKDQSDIKKVIGDYPAVYGWEIGHLETGDSLSIDNIHFAKIRELMLEAYHRGGINTVSWHLRNPFTQGSSWDVSSDKVVQSIIPGGDKHNLYIKWLDRLAAFFQSVQTKDGTLVPILFRPFHEHTGSWFWWGEKLCTKKDYIALWQFTVTYLRDKKNVHNLLYIYSPDFVKNGQEYFDRYPGDNYVDILGQDLYHRGGKETADKYISDVQNIMQMLSAYSHKSNKPFIFSETGAEQIPMNNWFTEVLYKAVSKDKPAYILFWRNAYETPCHFYAPYPGHPAADDFIKFKHYPDILFESRLPAMYK